MIRLAAVADIHLGLDSHGVFDDLREELEHSSDLFVIAGDITRHGTAEEAKVAGAELSSLTVPTVAILGNHDHHSGEEREVRAILEDSGVTMLENESTIIEVDGTTVGVAGHKGFGGGFLGACGSDFGETEMKAFVRHTMRGAHRFGEVLSELETEVKIAAVHYAPIEETLEGERLEIFPFLGSYLLGQAIDSGGADLAIHGHAHAGKERGTTPGGVPVRNVAQAVIGRPFKVYELGA